MYAAKTAQGIGRRRAHRRVAVAQRGQQRFQSGRIADFAQDIRRGDPPFISAAGQHRRQRLDGRGAKQRRAFPLAGGDEELNLLLR